MHVDARLSPAIDGFNTVGAWYSIPQGIPTMLVCKHFNGFHSLNINKQLALFVVAIILLSQRNTHASIQIKTMIAILVLFCGPSYVQAASHSCDTYI